MLEKVNKLCNEYISQQKTLEQIKGALGKIYDKDEIEKFKLKIYVNQDYLSFYEYLYRYSYGESFMDQIIAKAFMNIPKIWPSPVVEMYDLRYIFELIQNNFSLARIFNSK